MSAKKIAIVGGGPGGVCAAMLLAARGFDVQLFEKQAEVGGRSGVLRLGSYTFDIGSTMLMMRFVLDEMFELAGTHTARELELMPLSPMYRLDFGSRSLAVYSEHERMLQELARFAPGSQAGYQQFLQQEHARLRHLYPVLQQTWPGLSSMLSRKVIEAAPHVGLGRSLHDSASDYFKDEHLRLGFSFQSAYLGMSPWECPSGFGMVPYVEHQWGLDHIRGGIHQLSFALARVAKTHGARVRTNMSVKRLLVEEERCVGVQLADGEVVLADEVIVDADASHALLSLLDQDVSFRFRRSHIAEQRESCSTFMLYLGLDTVLPLDHHTFFFAEDYRAEMERVFRSGSLAPDLSVYVCNPAATDRSLAPEGHSGLYLLALVPNTRADVDWEHEHTRVRSWMLNCARQRTGLDIESHIVRESSVTPVFWRDAFEVSHGAVFGPAHTLDQLLALRLPNQLPSPDNVFLVGGGTSPGSGLPTILESGRMAARLICERNGLGFPASRALPAVQTQTESTCT